MRMRSKDFIESNESIIRDTAHAQCAPTVEYLVVLIIGVKVNLNEMTRKQNLKWNTV